MKIRTGFTSFTKDGKYSPEFIDDVNVLISKIYSQWKLYEDEEEFGSFCWVKIIKTLPLYDSNISNLSTFLTQIVWNEATRLHSKHKKMSNEDITEKLHSESLWSQYHDDNKDLFHRDRVCSFARRAFDMGVFIDQEELYKNYLLGNLSAAVRAFMWYLIFSSNAGVYEN